MKTLILYATKHGTAKDLAERIASKFPDSTICDLKSTDIPPLSGFEGVIIGSSVYAGRIRKEAKKFVKKNADILATKRLGLYLAGMSPQEDSMYFPSNFPPKVLEAAVVKSLIGGVFDPAKAGSIERKIMETITKQSEYMSSIDDNRLEAFIDAMKKTDGD